jgi:hypothetical protein
MGKNGSGTQAEAVQRFLQQNAGKEFCHKCLAKAVGIKSVHRYIFQLINNPFFVRRRGRCEACASHRPKLLARYRGTPSPHEQNVISIRGGTAVGQNEKRTGPALSQGPNGQTRLRSGEPNRRCRSRTHSNRSLDGGLQHCSPALPAGLSLTARIHQC